MSPKFFVVMVVMMIITMPTLVVAAEFIATGSYTGDGQTTQSITGLGFQPEFVMVKSAATKPTHAKTVNMPSAYSKNLTKGVDLNTDRIETLDSDGFTVGHKVGVNEEGVEYYWVAMMGREGTLEIGEYTGNGELYQDIDLDNMNPDAALIMSAENNLSVFSHTDMGSLKGHSLDGNGEVANSFALLGENKITVRNGDEVNKAGTTYYYVAWNAESTLIESGSYEGTGTEDQDITGLSLHPQYLMISSNAAVAPVQRPASLTGDASLFFSNRPTQNNLIQSMWDGGFQVGTDESVNENGNTYYWLAFADPVATADLDVAISVDNGTPDVGETITITTTVTNLGPDQATGVQITQILSEELFSISGIPDQGSYFEETGIWDVGELDSDQSQTLVFTATVNAGTAGTILTETAEVTAADLHDPNNGNDSFSLDITVLDSVGADIAVAMSVDDDTPDEGQSFTYGISITNNGPDQGTNIQITDLLHVDLSLVTPSVTQGSYDSGTGIWDIGTMDVGETHLMTLAVLPKVGTSGTIITNTAAVTALDQTDNNNSNDSTSVDIAVNTVDMQVLKMVNNATPAEGATITYTVITTNLGPGQATMVQIDDVLPAGLTYVSDAPSQGSYDDGTGVWNIGTMAVSDTRNLVITATVDAATAGSTITNTATLGNIDQAEVNPANNTDTAVIDVSEANAVDLQLSQTIDNPAPHVGETVTYTVTLLNGGVGDATGIVVLNSLPEEVSFVSALTNKGDFDEDTGVWILGDLADGFQGVLNILALVEASAIGTTVTNTASITASDQTDPDTDNNTAHMEFNTPTCDLRVSNSVNHSAPSVGQTITFSMSISNDGPNAGTGIQVTAVLPPGTSYVSNTIGSGVYDEVTGIWTLPFLNPGMGSFLSIDALVESAAAGSTETCTTSITAIDQADPNYSNNTAASTITVEGADLALTLIASTAVALEGASVDLSLTLANDGPDDATAVQVLQRIPAGMTLVSAIQSHGSYNEKTGSWSVGSLNNGLHATLDLTLRVNSGTAGTIITNSAAITAGNPVDPNTDNNTDTVSITVPVGGLIGNTIWPLVGTATEALPGTRFGQQVLKFAFTNQGTQIDTLRAMTITNRTPGTGTLAQMDAEWQPLTLLFRQVRPVHHIVPAAKLSQSFVNGQAVFDDLNWVISPGDTLEVTVQGRASLDVRDGARLQVGIEDASDLDFTSDYTPVLDWPLVSGHVLTVNGFVAAQATVIHNESELLAIGSERNLALTVDLPGNGCLGDTLYGISLKNNGSALPGFDISSMQIWADFNDNGTFEAPLDTLLGSAIHSGDLWQLTGLSVPIPTTGRRFFATVDISETALPSRDIRLSLPMGNGFAVEMFSGNDGPVDVSLENPSTLGISDTDRIILFAEWSPSGTTLPGTQDATLLQFLMTNTYADDRQLQSLTFTNATEAMGATSEQRDETCQQVHLVLDTNGNGELDIITVDTRLGSGIYVEGKVVFNGLDLDLAAGSSTRLFVIADLGLTTVADGNAIKGQLQSVSDISIPGSSVVATWPLESGAEWLINGMVAEQITTRDVTILTLGPGEGPVLALDLTIPPNGYAEDELTGISFFNEGSAVATDLLVAQLWEDGGDGVFNAGFGDDLLLGPLTLSGKTWSSTVLSRAIPAGGTQLFTSLTVADAPQDSVTVKLAIPTGGITVSSGNDGPEDVRVPGTSNLVITTSPLRTSVVFEEDATNTGQNGTITMNIRNAGSDTVTDILPVLNFSIGEDLLSLFAPSPAIITALIPDGEATFTWEYASNSPGEVVMEGNVQGVVNGSQVRRSIVTPTSSHQIYTPVPRLDLYPTANLPFSINRGQQGVVPLTLTFINPGGSDVADAALSSIRIRLLESVDGAGIVPAELLEQVIVAEGTNIYFESSEIPDSGMELNLEFSNPVIVTGAEPVTLSLRLDLRLNSVVPSFLISIEDATWLVCNDAVDMASLTVVTGEGAFPVRTGQATLVSQAEGLNIAVNAQEPGNTVPGQSEILLAEINLSQANADDSSSSIDLGRLAFKFHDAAGNPLTDPSLYFTNLSLRSVFQEHYSGTPVVESDSLVILQLAAPVTVSGNTNLVLRLIGDLAEDSPLGQVTPLLGAVDYFDARDGNMNNPVPVFFTTAPDGPVLNILEPASALTVTGTGTMPAQISQGTRNLTAMTMSLTNPGGANSSSAICDTLVLNFFNAARQPLNTGPFLDRIRISQGAVDLSVQIDPVSVNGLVVFPLTGLELAPSEQADLLVSLDFKAEAQTGTMEVVLQADGIKAFDTISGQALEILVAEGGSLPISSSVAAIVAPADELTVGVTNLMPPLLVPNEHFSPVFSLQMFNPAAENSGGIQINTLTLSQDAAKSATPNLGEFLQSVQLVLDDNIVATVTDLEPTDTFVILTPDSPLVVDADRNIDLVVEILLKATAPPGALGLILAESGVDAGPPGGGGSPVRVLAVSGQTFPFISESGNIGSATLAESYANYPNPFAAGQEPTTFAFSLLQDAEVNLRIMTPHGELVTTLLQNEHRSAGFYQDDLWEGYNGNGSPVYNGVYLAELVVRYSDGTKERLLRKVAVVR